MNSVTTTRIDNIPAYEGPHQIDGVAFRAARAALELTAFGMNVLDLEAHCTGHPRHDHAHDGQEEVYVVLSGAVDLVVDGDVHPLTAGDLARVSPTASRQLVTKASSARVLALGGVPGAAYTVSPGM